MAGIRGDIHSNIMTMPRLVFTVLIVTTTFFGDEFPSDGHANFWYSQELFGVPLQYPALVGLLLLLSPFAFATPRVSLVSRFKRSGLWLPVVTVWLALAVAMAYAILDGAPELFADSRNFVIMGVVVVVAGRWLTDQPWREYVIGDLALGYGLAALIPLGAWAIGAGGSELFGESTPIFYYPPLFMTTFASLTTLGMWLVGIPSMSKVRSFLVRLVAVTSTFTVLVSFRRAFWVAWVAAFVFLVFLLRRRLRLEGRKVVALLVGISLITTAAVLVLGSEAVVKRLQSILPGDDNDYAITNEDHLNDVAQALSIIAEAPITGLGIGQFYKSPLIAEWKDKSFEVHNAPVHVWLKFGILGLMAFLWFHFAWIRYESRANALDRSVRASHLGLAAYLVAQFVNTLTQTWVYGSFQMSVHLAVLLAAAAAAAHDRVASAPSVGQTTRVPVIR